MAIRDWLERAGGAVDRGLGRAAQQLFVAPDDVDPAQAEQIRRQALLRMGLGMMAAGAQGRGLGEGVYGAYDQAAQTADAAFLRAYQNARQRRQEAIEEQRYQEGRQERADDRQWRRAREAADEAARQRDYELRARELGLRAQQARRADQLTRAELEQQAGAIDRMRMENARLQELMRKGWARLTPEEREEFEVLRTGRRPSQGLGAGWPMPGLPALPGIAGPTNPIALDDSLFAP